ncbi:DUF934 domain-containing protein [Asaia krungthepensis]|uniref:Oxidoreductase n=1 Tax=Asaia krungthepensis NRIC 0535 TaxID=1307925 RepID=A0ABQ0PXL6_9PROT|nr:DUF934 domain-containing protein [Asaia krungthepensis]GBQ84136.1 hypothetical protein AA0535_0424 [Asaia krungthepensis NRIC 0535]
MKQFNLGPVRHPAPATLDIVSVGEMTDATRAIRLSPDFDVETLGSALDHLDLIIVTFPIFRDGRGFTQARALREYFGFAGEIRAEGHLIPDQAQFLWTCGVDAVQLEDDTDTTPWLRALTLFPVTYQARLGLR